MVSSEATGMPEGKRMRGHTKGVPVPAERSPNMKVTSLPDEESIRFRRSRAAYVLSSITKPPNRLNPHGFGFRTRVQLGTISVVGLCHAAFPLRDIQSPQ